MGVNSAYSLDLPPDRGSMSDRFICSGTVIIFLGDEFPFAMGIFDNDSTELSIGDRVPPSIGGDAKAWGARKLLTSGDSLTPGITSSDYR